MGKLNISEKLIKIKPYVVDKTNYSVRLDANESFLAFPEELKTDLWKALNNVMFNRYPDTDSTELCMLYGRYCGIDPKYILAGNGSDEIIQILINGFLDCGDAVLTLKPDFSMYKFFASLMGAYVLEYDLGEELEFKIEDFVRLAKDEDVKLIIFSAPNNPTGRTISREEILYIVDKVDALVVVDEAYFEFCGETVIDCITEFENLAVMRTCSKAMSLAAARVGFIIAGEKIIENFKKVKTPFNVNALSQAAAAVILRHPELIKSNVEKIISERDYLYERLVELQKRVGREKFQIYPTKSNFVYIKSSEAKKIYESLKEKAIGIRFFGKNLRINAGSREENDALLAALEEIL
ncbi:histidinol-phosphate transaminase [Clostridium thermarum]|uniref:histidinol-phosphate transaminase n=1 Tax=Clostridium thermarum TaxID=1716543 RepID=UPI00111CB0E6|nr:histidinol-phosphate transaminase [Clostridium thermarum]